MLSILIFLVGTDSVNSFKLSKKESSNFLSREKRSPNDLETRYENGQRYNEQGIPKWRDYARPVSSYISLKQLF